MEATGRNRPTRRNCPGPELLSLTFDFLESKSSESSFASLSPSTRLAQRNGCSHQRTHQVCKVLLRLWSSSRRGSGVPLRRCGCCLSHPSILTACLSVDAGHRAIIYSKISGVDETVRGEGTWLKIPYIQQPLLYDVRIQPHQVASTTGTKGS